MTRIETSQAVAKQNQEVNAMSAVDAFSPERAAQYAEQMYQLRNKGWSDKGRALQDVARQCGLSARSLERIIKRETKEIGIQTFGRIHKAYLKFCMTLIDQLNHQIEQAEREHGNAAFADIAADVEALQAKAENRLNALQQAIKRHHERIG
jgi:transcriptional regulator with XRE-family HTH domain